MTTPSAPDSPDRRTSRRGPVDLGKPTPAAPSGDPTADAPFDPYRFGKPDHPVPPEYAPPGYVPDEPPPPYAAATNAPYGQGPYGPPHGRRTGSRRYGRRPTAAALRRRRTAAVPGPYPARTGPRRRRRTTPTASRRPATARPSPRWCSGIVSMVHVLADLPRRDLHHPGAHLRHHRADREPGASNGAGRGMAIAGLVCAGLGTIATVAVHGRRAPRRRQVRRLPEQRQLGFKQCVQDHL